MCTDRKPHLLAALKQHRKQVYNDTVEQPVTSTQQEQKNTSSNNLINCQKGNLQQPHAQPLTIYQDVTYSTSESTHAVILSITDKLLFEKIKSEAGVGLKEMNVHCLMVMNFISDTLV